MKTLITLLFVSLLALQGGNAQESSYLTLNVVDDGYIQSGITSFTTTGWNMRVKKNYREAYLFFDLSDANLLAANDSIILEVTMRNDGSEIVDHTFTTDFAISGVSSEIDLPNFNWAARPTDDFVELDTITISEGDLDLSKTAPVGTFQFNVTGFINSMKSAGLIDTVALRLYLSGGDDYPVVGKQGFQFAQNSGTGTSGYSSKLYCYKKVAVATLSGGGSVVTGNSMDLSIDVEGTPPYSIVYNNGTSDVTINNIMTSPYTLEVSPTENAAYTLVSITDGNASIGSVSGSAYVEVYAANDSVIYPDLDFFIDQNASGDIQTTTFEGYYMKVKNQSAYSRESYVKFAVPTISGTVTEAKLSLYVSSASVLSSGGTDISVYLLSAPLVGNETWSASQVALEADGVLVSSTHMNEDDLNKRIYLDIKSYLDTLTSSSVSFRITGSTTDYVIFNTQETSQKPALIYQEGTATQQIGLKIKPAIVSSLGHMINLRSDKIIQSVSIYNIAGQMLTQVMPNANQFDSDIMKRGIYIVQYMIDGNIEIEKVAVN